MADIPKRYLLTDMEFVQAKINYAPGVLKRLPDGTVACLHDLAFTRSIQLGCTTFGPDYRFCFDPRELADAEFEKLKAWDDVPTGWIARRPQED